MAAISDLDLSITKQELRAELRDLEKVLNAARDKLRSLSRDLDKLLTHEPLDAADQLGKLLKHLVVTKTCIGNLPRKPKFGESQHAIAFEMTRRVLRILKENGISTAATLGAGKAQSSDAIVILKAIGDEIRIVRQEVTWRDLILEVKKKTRNI